MIIKLNNEPLSVPSDYMNIAELLEWRNIPGAGTAVALNNRLVPRNRWDSQYLNNDDDIVIISAAFGG